MVIVIVIVIVMMMMMMMMMMMLSLLSSPPPLVLLNPATRAEEQQGTVCKYGPVKCYHGLARVNPTTHHLHEGAEEQQLSCRAEKQISTPHHLSPSTFTSNGPVKNDSMIGRCESNVTTVHPSQIHTKIV